MPAPFEEAENERTIEAEALPDLFNFRRGRLIAGDHGSGIAGREIEQREDKQRDNRHHRYRRQQPLEHIEKH